MKLDQDVAKTQNLKAVQPDRRSYPFGAVWPSSTALQRCVVVNALQKRWTRAVGICEIVDMLGATKFDLKERRVMIDIESLELLENDGGVFGGKLLVLAVVVQRARQDRIALFLG